MANLSFNVSLPFLNSEVIDDKNPVVVEFCFGFRLILVSAFKTKVAQMSIGYCTDTNKGLTCENVGQFQLITLESE